MNDSEFFEVPRSERDTPIEQNAGSAIAEKLRPMITEERLAQNALQYPEMQRELSPRDERQIAAIRERILGMPLTHATRNPNLIDVAKEEGLKPHIEGLFKGTTRPIDQSLGLDEYVFMHWGEIDDVYGHDIILIDAHAMLENTLVTPLDITRAAPSKLDLKPWNYRDLPQEGKDSVEERYFGRMVTGKDWLEIWARKVHEHAKQKPEYPYPIDEYDTVGEIKRHGTVPPEFIIGELKLPEDGLDRRHERREWGDTMWKHGIALGTSPYALDTRAEILKYEPEEKKQFLAGGWKDIMAIE